MKALVSSRLVREKCYRGEILLFKKVPGLCELVKLFEENYLPQLKRNELEAVEVMKMFESDTHAEALFRKALFSVGAFEKVGDNSAIEKSLEKFGKDDLYLRWDRLRLRIQSPNQGSIDDLANVKYANGRFSHTLPLHRDTWGSGILCQLNWWAPLQHLTKEATLALYPDCFAKEIPNTSDEWSFEQLKKSRKEGIPYPQMPSRKIMSDEEKTDAQGLDLGREIRIVIDPGDMICFSSQHLHRSVPNTTKNTRFNVEVRTYSTVDFLSGIGAKNTDTYGTERPNTAWFKTIEPRPSTDGKRE
eukprot:g132.t1